MSNQQCQYCHGTSVIPSYFRGQTSKRVCTYCNGTGQMEGSFELLYRKAERTQSYWVEMIMLYADMKRSTKWVRQLANLKCASTLRV